LHWNVLPAAPVNVIVCDVELVGFAVGLVRVTIGAAGPVPIVHVTEPAVLTLPAASVCVTE
jgi:hypothetical protein